MEQFKKDLITTGRPSFIPALILGIIAIISAVTGFAFEFSRYDNFDPTQKGLAQLNAYISWDHSLRRLLMEK